MSKFFLGRAVMQRELHFVLMPFGKKLDASANLADFDASRNARK